MSREWYFVENGQQRGPVPTDELKGMVRTGRLRGQDLVWNESLAEWTPVSRLPEVAAAPAAAVPPRPAVIHAAPAPAPSHDPYAGQVNPYGAPAAGGSSLLSYQTPGGMDTPVSPRALEMLRQTKPWVRFISVLTFIVAGLMALGGFGMLVGGVAMQRRGGIGVSGFAMVVYVATACFYAIPAVFLGRFASRIADLLQTRRSSDLEAALEAQKSFWRFVGILTLIAIGLWVLFVLIMVIGVVGVAASRR
jgi:hypothetical protein